MTSTRSRLTIAAAIVAILILAIGVAVIIVQPWKPDANALSAAPVDADPAANASGGVGTWATVSGWDLAGTTPYSPRPRPADQQLIINQRNKCAANLKQIGNGLIFYAQEFRGAYPPDLGTLAREEDMTPQPFICPAVGKIAPDVPNMPSQDIGNWVNINTDYIYIPGLSSAAGAGIAVVYEKNTNEYGDGMNILFCDGHVEFLPLDQARDVISRSVVAALRARGAGR